MDYVPQAKYDKITCLEMAEHVDTFKITNFLRQCSDLLEDDGWSLATDTKVSSFSESQPDSGLCSSRPPALDTRF